MVTKEVSHCTYTKVIQPRTVIIFFSFEKGVYECMHVCMYICMYYLGKGCVCSVMNVDVRVLPTLLNPLLPTCKVWNSSSGHRGRKHLTCWEFLLTHEFIFIKVSTPQESNWFFHKSHFHFRTRYFLLWEDRISIDRLPELIPR